MICSVASQTSHSSEPSHKHCCCCCLGMVAPVEVGAQGTVGSLVLREVEYFRRMNVAGGGGGGGHGNKSSSSKVVAASGGSPRSNSNSNSKKPNKPKKKKKKKDAVAGSNNGSFLPRMCSSAEVAEDPGSGRRRMCSRVRYRPLVGDDDGDALPQQAGLAS